MLRGAVPLDPPQKIPPKKSPKIRGGFAQFWVVSPKNSKKIPIRGILIQQKSGTAEPAEPRGVLGSRGRQLRGFLGCWEPP